MWKSKQCEIAKETLNDVKGHTLPDFKIYYKTTDIKTVVLVKGQTDR